jgi:hypothetical protein
MPRQKKKTEIDYGDEEAVLAAVAADMEADIEECVIQEDRGMSSFGEGTVYQVDWGVEEYHVAENYDQAYALVVAVVKQDLEQEPELFNKDFIESHINTDRLRDELESDVTSHHIDDLSEMAENDPEDFWKHYEREGFGDTPEEDDEGELPTPTDRQIEELAHKRTEEDLRDPMEYLEEIYGREDAAKEAIRIAGIDVDAAAEDAVDTDGWEHFLARYDDNSHETGSGLIYWRVN